MTKHGWSEHQQELQQSLEIAENALERSANVLELPLWRQIGFAVGVGLVVLHPAAGYPIAWLVSGAGVALIFWLAFRQQYDGVWVSGWTHKPLRVVSIIYLSAFGLLYASSAAWGLVSDSVGPIIAIAAVSSSLTLVYLQVWMGFFRRYSKRLPA